MMVINKNFILFIHKILNLDFLYVKTYILTLLSKTYLLSFMLLYTKHIDYINLSLNNLNLLNLNIDVMKHCEN